MAKFGQNGQIWLILSTIDVIVVGEYVRFKVFTLYVGEKWSTVLTH